MIKDIGSIFPLSVEEMSLRTHSRLLSAKNGGRINFSLCREAMYAVALKYEYTEKIVLIPAYTCQTVIDPFTQLGWKCYYYNINTNLRIDTEDLLHKYNSIHPNLVVVHPYHGVELNDTELRTLKLLKDRGCVLMQDITQCIYTDHRPVIFDYFVGSYRKWFQVPDGGFVEYRDINDILVPENENEVFVARQTDAMYLRGRYFETEDEIIKSISIKLNKEAVACIGQDIKCHKMSDFSLSLMEGFDITASIERRFLNYSYLYRHIKRTEGIRLVCSDIEDVTTAPLYFPIYVENRAKIQKILAENHIYAPVLWPVSTNELLINEGIKYIYSHILMIPIDQRYDEDDMMRIVELINQK